MSWEDAYNNNCLESSRRCRLWDRIYKLIAQVSRRVSSEKLCRKALAFEWVLCQLNILRVWGAPWSSCLPLQLFMSSLDGFAWKWGLLYEHLPHSLVHHQTPPFAVAVVAAALPRCWTRRVGILDFIAFAWHRESEREQVLTHILLCGEHEFE